MKIIKYTKKGLNKYELLLEDNTKITLYEDLILKEELLLKKEIDDIESLIKKNNDYSLYDLSIKFISRRVRSIKETKDYLYTKSDNTELIEDIINTLINNNMLDDEYFTKCYINDHINLSNDGPYKIIEYLESNNISSKIYSKYLKYDKDLIYKKINKYIERNLKTNKKSNYVFKNKMIINLMNLGFNKEDIEYCLKDYSIDEKELKEQEELKIRNKLSKKYSGYELECKIKEKLYQKGYKI